MRAIRRSIPWRLTDRMPILGGRHLRLVMAELCLALQRTATPSQPRTPPPLWPDHPLAVISQKRIRRRSVLSGLVNEYEPAA